MRDSASEHGHRQSLVEGVSGERIGRVGGGGENVRLPVDPQKVRRVAATRALGVIHMDRALADHLQRILAEAEFVDRVRMQVDTEIVPVGSD